MFVKEKAFFSLGLLITILILGCVLYMPYIFKIIQPIKYGKWALNLQTLLLRTDVQSSFKKTSIKIHYFNMPRRFPKDIFQGCDYNCTYSSFFNTSDVVIFHGPQVNATPPRKYPGQIWIMCSGESPYHHRSSFVKWKGKVNWTMTYRFDSDILSLYANIKKREGAIQTGDIKKLLKSRHENLTVMAASNCNPPSRRMQFVNKLRKFIPVHVYGACGRHKCSKLNEERCIEMFKKKYKFYLSFENSLCRDYVTEKMFKLFREKPTFLIPITRGDEHAYPRLFPPGSYIDVSSFKTIKDLAYYVKILMQNETMYLTYFRHVTRYTYYRDRKDRMCNLCKKFHHSEKYKRVYADFDEWLKLSSNDRKACHLPRDQI